MIYESRIYHTVPGKLPELHARISNHTMGYFKKHGIGIMGFWSDEIGAGNKLTSVLTFESLAAREEIWASLRADPDHQQARAEYEAEGPLVVKITNRLMQLTDYSPEPHLSSEVQEVRVYDAMPGKTTAMHQRFSNHTLNSFERAGIDSIAFWTEIVGTSNRLVYMLGYSSLGDREKCWTAHLTNAEWRKARAESEKDGPLVRATHHTLIRPTPYSPR